MCDDTLKLCNYQICADRYNKTGFVDAAKEGFCKTVASAMYQFVDKAGSSSYKSAQKNNVGCAFPSK